MLRKAAVSKRICDRRRAQNAEISKIKQKYSLRVEDIDLFQKDVEIVREGEVESLSRHFRSKIEEARKISGEAGSVQSFYATIKEELQQFDNE
ncbi:MAG: hypothetical protein KHZ72_12710 [Lachnospiraceae bacterium]|nr:hypothetical protein [Lachnospiraceae bacterium]